MDPGKKHSGSTTLVLSFQTEEQKEELESQGY
jgi:hypothetical protein